MSFATTTCPLCSKEVQQIQLLMHVPKCYREICINMDVLPLCTCNSCEGIRPHPGDELKKQKEEKKTTTKKLLHSQLAGKSCLLCKTKRSPSNSHIPLISVGKYKTVLLCKKSHLTDEQDSARIVEFLDDEVTRIRETGDSRSNILQERSEDETEEEHQEENHCSGYLDLDGERCNLGTDDSLSVEYKKKKYFFCKGSHLVRFLLFHICAQGKQTGERKRKHSSKVDLTSN